jgi:hypothetical protein
MLNLEIKFIKWHRVFILWKSRDTEIKDEIKNENNPLRLYNINSSLRFSKVTKNLRERRYWSCEKDTYSIESKLIQNLTKIFCGNPKERLYKHALQIVVIGNKNGSLIKYPFSDKIFIKITEIRKKNRFITINIFER